MEETKKNKIGNVIYNFTTRTYKGGGVSKDFNKDLEIIKYEIIKETPKYFKIKITNYLTFLWSERKLQIQNREHLENYKKENVTITGIMMKEDVIKKLNEFKKDFKKSDDLSNNDKKQLIEAVDIYLNYFNNNN